MASPHLPARPRAETWPVEDLVDRIQSGTIRIPAFQRPLRWKGKHVENLFDSIWHGYPIGSLLFWRRPGPAETIRLGALGFSVDQRSDALYVIDGQQRLTAMANVLLHSRPSRTSRDIFALWFDLAEERFVGPTLHDTGAPQIPMNKVLDAVELQSWWADQHHLQARTELFRTALLLGKRIREYQLPSYVVETDENEEEVLRVIFTRLNTSGVGMRLSEVFRALHLEDGGQDPLSHVAQVLAESRMGTWNREALLQCLRSAAGDDLSTPMAQEPEAYTNKVPAACDAISIALDFLRDEIRVPHIKLLPSRYPLLALVRFFSMHASPPERARTLLRRWFWRGIVTRRNLDMNNPRLHWIYEDVGEDLEATLSAMLADAGKPTLDEIHEYAASLLGRTARSAGAVIEKVGLTVLADRDPRDLRSGESIDIALLVEEAGTSAYAPVKRSSGHWRVVHARIDDLDGALDRASPAVQASHLWVSGDPDGAERRKLLQAAFADRLVAWCEPGASDHLPILPALAALGEE